jgi:hypothetical protein
MTVSNYRSSGMKIIIITSTASALVRSLHPAYRGQRPWKIAAAPKRLSLPAQENPGGLKYRFEAAIETDGSSAIKGCSSPY